MVGGVQRKLDEIRALGDELKALRAKLATGQAGELAAPAIDGVVVHRVDGLAPGELRDLALAVRNEPGVDVVVLGGESSTGGVSLVAAVRPGVGHRGRGPDPRRRQGRRRRRRRQGRRRHGRGQGPVRASTRRCASPRRPPPPSRSSGPMRALGIDLGSKRIGVAVSDRSGTIASPLTVLARGRSRRDDHERIAALVREEEAELVVVGLPLSLSGGDGPAATAARAEGAGARYRGRRARRDPRRAAHHGDRRRARWPTPACAAATVAAVSTRSPRRSSSSPGSMAAHERR